MDKYNAALLQICKEENLFCIDLAAEVPKSRKYFMDDMHLNEAGADLVAAIVARELAKYRMAGQ